MFMEEGVHYLNSKLQEKIARNIRIPMAAGERLYTRWDTVPILRNRHWT